MGEEKMKQSAFPSVVLPDIHLGLSKFEWLCGMALVGMTYQEKIDVIRENQTGSNADLSKRTIIARECCRQADALLKEMEKYESR
jgi:hypothetical protein